jgi:cytochrome P450
MRRMIGRTTVVHHVDAGVSGRFESEGAPAELPSDPDEIMTCLFDAERRGELYPLYHQLREIAPVHRSLHPSLRNVWIITRFGDALELYRNPRVVSDPAVVEHFNHGGECGPFYRMLKEMMLFLESEQHAHVRRIVMKAFTPRAIERVRPVTEEYAQRLLDELAPDHEMDLVSQFAYPLPFRVIAFILGVPEADFAEIERYAYDFARGSELAVEVNDRSRRADDAALGLGDYFTRLIDARRQDSRDDIISALIAAEDDGRYLSREQLVATVVLLMQAGHETTTDSLGNAMVALFRHPGQLERLRREPELTKNAVEELVRFDPTNQMNNRLLLEDVRLGDVHLSAGDHAAIVIGAANRDPARFAEPDRLDLSRPLPLHLAFAFGAYYCVGNALARVELQVALRALVDRLPGLRPGGDTFEWRNTLRNRGPQRVPLAW